MASFYWGSQRDHLFWFSFGKIRSYYKVLSYIWAPFVISYFRCSTRRVLMKNRELASFPWKMILKPFMAMVLKKWQKQKAIQTEHCLLNIWAQKGSFVLLSTSACRICYIFFEHFESNLRTVTVCLKNMKNEMKKLFRKMFFLFFRYIWYIYEINSTTPIKQLSRTNRLRLIRFNKNLERIYDAF